ncbi:MAG: hypothetical protein R6U63_12200 [Longimicrobiales bacterium]
MPHIDDGTLHALLDGALRAEEPEQADTVDAHLDACADCRARLEHAAALRDQASDVLAALDAGLAGEGDPITPTPDFGEVLARGGADPHTGAPSTVDPVRAAGLRRRLGWTRGLAWAATIVVALGTGYIIRDIAGPTGEVPRAATRTEAKDAATPPVTTGAARSEEESVPTESNTVEAVEPPPPTPTAERTAAGAGEGTGPEEGAAKTPQPEAVEAVEAAGAETLIRAREQATLLDAAPTAQLRQDPTAGIRSVADRAAETGALEDAPIARHLMSSTVVQGIRNIVPVAGCYRLELGEWSPPRGEGETAYPTPPERFELTAVRAPNDPEGVRAEGTPVMEMSRLLLRSVIDADPLGIGGPPGAYWAPLGPDSLRLVWSNGFVGVALEVAVRGDTLQGVARGSSDVSAPPLPTAPARAVRVSCDEGGG